MIKFLAKRFLQALLMIFFISVITFGLMHMAPGDPGAAYITPQMTPQQVQQVRVKLGLDQPVYIQYIKWLSNVLQGDLGHSLIDFRPITGTLKERIPATFGLMGASLIISLLISIPIGLCTGLKKNSFMDKFVTFISYIGISIPSFWFSIMLIYVFSVKLHMLPSVGMRTIGIENSVWDVIKHGIMPCIVLSFYNISIYTRYIRSSTISELRNNYVRTAEAFGLPKSKILLKYVFKNVLLPVITILCMGLPGLVTGAFVTETVFAWPGMGRLGVNAIFNYDYPMIMAITMITSILLILGNLLADILYSFVDPRIKDMR